MLPVARFTDACDVSSTALRYAFATLASHIRCRWHWLDERQTNCAMNFGSEYDLNHTQPAYCYSDQTAPSLRYFPAPILFVVGFIRQPWAFKDIVRFNNAQHMAPHPRFVGIGAGDHRKNNVFLIRGSKITAHSRGDVSFHPTPPGWVSVRVASPLASVIPS